MLILFEFPVALFAILLFSQKQKKAFASLNNEDNKNKKRKPEKKFRAMFLS